MTNDERKALERQIIRKLIRMMKEAGWAVFQVDDGGEERVKVTTEGEAMDAIFAVDDSQLILKKDNTRHVVCIVLGNSHDVITDYSFNESDNFEATMDAHSAYVDALQD